MSAQCRRSARFPGHMPGGLGPCIWIDKSAVLPAPGPWRLTVQLAAQNGQGQRSFGQDILVELPWVADPAEFARVPVAEVVRQGLAGIVQGVAQQLRADFNVRKGIR